ncbi:MAG: Sec-independent protein translocase protein TatB [Vitreimonas sp.]
MLPSLGFQEILLLGILALVVVGPKDLPLMLRKLGRWTAKLRGMAQEFRSGFDELARQAELDELKREVEALRRTTSITEISREMQKPLPTLEDYAGLPRSPPPPALETPEGDHAPTLDAPTDGPRAAAEASAAALERGSSDPLAPVAAEESASEDARSKALDAPEHAGMGPSARSAP